MDPLFDRRRLRRVVMLAALLAATQASGDVSSAARVRPAAPPRETRSAEARENAEEIRALVALVNRHRRAIGRAPLAWDERLAKVAQRHSESMARSAFFSHQGRNGDNPFDRLDHAGIHFRAAAENIASGQISAREVFEGWMDSPGHRTNLENGLYTHHGIGLYRNRWTHVFAKY